MARSAYISKREPMFKCLVCFEINLFPLKDVKFRCQNWNYFEMEILDSCVMSDAYICD